MSMVFRGALMFLGSEAPSTALRAVPVRSQARSVQGGANPSQVILLRPVADRNCVTARWGGEQREATESSVAKANSIRPYRLASLRRKGEAQACERKHRRPMTLRG